MRYFIRLFTLWFIFLACTVLVSRTQPVQFQSTLSPPAWVLPGFIFDFDFINQRYWASGQTASVSGLFSFTRASGARMDNQAGIWQLFASAVPRITDKGFLSELLATNVALQNRDMTNVVWTASNVTAAQTATGIDGIANSATTLTATAGNGTVLQTVTQVSAANVYSVWLKRRTGTGNIDITIDGGTTWTTQTVTSTYTKFQVTKTAANPSVGIRIVTSGDAVDADFNQLEAGSIATSPIATSAASGTRAADVLTMRWLGAISNQQGTVFHEWQESPTGTKAATTYYQLRTDSNNSVVQQVTSGLKVNMASTSGGVTTFSGTATNNIAAGGIYRVAFSFAVNNFATAMTSALATAAVTQVSAAVVPVGTITGVGIGGSAPGTLQCNCYVRRWAYTPLNLPAGQLLNWAQGN